MAVRTSLATDTALSDHQYSCHTIVPRRLIPALLNETRTPVEGMQEVLITVDAIDWLYSCIKLVGLTFTAVDVIQHRAHCPRPLRGSRH